MIDVKQLTRVNLLWWFFLVCSGFFVDIKKGFDSSNHAILLQNLALYGICGPEVSYIYKWPSPSYIATWSSNIFPDDSAIYTTGKSSMETKCALQSSVYGAGRWFDSKNLPINIKKIICYRGQPKSGCPRRTHVVSGIDRHNSWTGSDHPVPWPSTRWQAVVRGACSKVMLDYFFETRSFKQTM